MNSNEICLDWRILTWSIGGIALVFFGGNAGLLLVYVVLAYLGIKDFKNIVPALLLVNIILNTNSVSSVSMKTIINVLLVIIYFILAIIQLTKRNCKIGQIGIVFAFMCGLFLLSSFKNSEFLAISSLKLISFICLFYSLYCGLQKTNFYSNLKYLYNYWAAFVILSTLCLFFWTQYAYLLNGRSFQGISVHPITFGVIVSIFCLIFLSIYIYYKKTLSRSFMFLFIISAYLIVLTNCRTAVVWFYVSFLTLLLFSFVFDLEQRRKLSLKILMIILIGSLFTYSIFYDKITSFLFKESRGVVYHKDIGTLTSSRQGLMGASWDNFASDPIWGIGFGSPSGIKDFEVTMLPGTNIPISAPTEKGNFLLANLETVGLMGTIAILFLFVKIVYKIKGPFVYIKIAAFLIVIFINLTECFMYGVNSIGALFWYCCLLGIKETTN
ncbi:MAG: O-antigen ligase family protein [Phycisphaerae bacterium]|nr:O-antigen ligase family protein [Phycisphaerae bacterium]